MVPWKEKRNTGCVIHVLLGLVALSSAFVQLALATEVVFGMQLNDDTANSYGSGMVYDAKTHRLYITGATYSAYFKRGEGVPQEVSSLSDCFLAVMQLPTQVFMAPQWIRRVQIGMQNVSEACSSLYVSQTNGDIYLLGHSINSSSIMSPLAPQVEGSHIRPSAVASGLVMHLSRGASILGGMVMESSEVQYPIAIQGDDDSEHLFVASVKSTDRGINPSFKRMKTRVANATQIDMSTGGYMPPEYGSNFTIILKSLKRQLLYKPVQGFEKNELRETLEPVWSREFGRDLPRSLQVSSLLYVSSGILIMGGSTQRSEPIVDADAGNAGEDWDGFLLVVDPSTGDQLRSLRIQSLPHGDDRILGVCKSESASSEIYVVGITEGSIDYDGKPMMAESLKFQQGSYRAFLIRLDARTLETTWVSYLGATYRDSGASQPPQVHGMACAVTSDGEEVYMAGTVKDGAVLMSPNPLDALKVEAKSFGGDDIFIAQYKANNGNLNYAKQLGTTYDDSLGQGVSLVTNMNGDAVILGNTNGSFMRKKISPVTTDMFVLSIARKRGYHLPRYEALMDIGEAEAYLGFSKSMNPYYVTPETDKTANFPTRSTSLTGIGIFDEHGGHLLNESATPLIPNSTLVSENYTIARVQNISFFANEVESTKPLVNTTNGTATQANGTTPTNTERIPISTYNSSSESFDQNETENGPSSSLLSNSNNQTAPAELEAQNENNLLLTGVNITTEEEINNVLVDTADTQNNTGLNQSTSNETVYELAGFNISGNLNGTGGDSSSGGQATVGNAASDNPRGDPEHPSYEAESGAVFIKPPKNPFEGLESSSPTLVVVVANGTAVNDDNAEQNSLPPTESDQNEFVAPSPHLRTNPPATFRPPIQNVVISKPGVNEGTEPSLQLSLPYIVALVIVANLIVAVAFILICVFRKRGNRQTRIVPGIDDDFQGGAMQKLVHQSGEPLDVSEFIGEGRWKADSMEVSMEYSDSMEELVIENGSDRSGDSVLNTESHMAPLDGQVIMEMRPPCTPPSVDAAKSPSFCSAVLWGSRPPPPQSFSLRSQSSLSKDDSCDDDIRGDKYSPP